MATLGPDGLAYGADEGIKVGETKLGWQGGEGFGPLFFDLRFEGLNLIG